MSSAPHPFFTIGHSTRTVGQLVELLRASDVQLVVDIRTVPRSRTNPQFNADVLEETLRQSGIGYERIAELGGLRGSSPDVPAAVNGFWQNRSFHNYADHAIGTSFREGLARLRELGQAVPCAMMCAEAVWWRCHRRIVADHLIATGETVCHILGPGKVEPARLTEAARIAPDGTLTYPADVRADGQNAD
ncbi:DUF488 domain-containing protein [Marinimicrococcus flavescens]|uniref:DUF488 domain-containing protein n=1 Tax=Marinimicrococcus flavescens TaxID=3031815 RepID=A0AAP3UZ51_9PROT|nr:DUF488 domain-containing protein [Marinimicrococcus flavescens]